MSVYYENNIQKKMVTVLLVIDASFCDVLRLQDMDYVNIIFVCIFLYISVEIILESQEKYSK